MVSTIPLVDTITPRPEPLQATPHPEQAPVAVRLPSGQAHEPTAVLAVERAERGWRAARDAAERIRLSNLAPEERSAVERVIKLETEAAEVEELRDLVIAAPQGKPIRIRDVANVQTSFPGFVATARRSGLRVEERSA